MSTKTSGRDSGDDAYSGQQIAATPIFYEAQSNLLCKNKCGYYGNSMQYDGYCSICYRKLKKDSSITVPVTSSFGISSSSSLNTLPPSASFDESSLTYDEKRDNLQIWNEAKNLNKLSSKKKQQQETRRTNSSFNKLFSRRPSSSIANAVVDKVSAVADKATLTAANLVDSASNYSLPHTFSSSSLLSAASSSASSASSSLVFLNSGNNMAEPSLLEFNQCITRLLSPSPFPSASSPLTLLGISSNTSGVADLNSSSLLENANVALSEFETKFRNLFKHLYSDLLKQMQQFVDGFLEALKRKKLTGNNQFEIVQDFYKRIYKYITTSASIRSFINRSNAIINSMSGDQSSPSNPQRQSNVNNTQQEQQHDDAVEKIYEAIMIFVESFVTNKIYDYAFPSLMGEFEEQDMKLQKRIRSLYWVTNDMIGTCIDENSIFYKDSYEEALNYIVQLDSKRTAYEKMLCITECSKYIYKAINISSEIARSISEITATEAAVSSQTPDEQDDVAENDTEKIQSETTKPKPPVTNLASADDYLPAFIYIVLKANPTMLYSNMNFITRFAFEKRVLQGEHAYYFCSLNAVITHIENLNANHLNMSNEQFETFCNGLADTDSTSNVLKLIQTNLKILSELKNKEKLLKRECSKLQNDMSSFRQTINEKFLNCISNISSEYIPEELKNMSIQCEKTANSNK